MLQVIFLPPQQQQQQQQQRQQRQRQNLSAFFPVRSKCLRLPTIAFAVKRKTTNNCQSIFYAEF
jgi:hypothetical protein